MIDRIHGEFYGECDCCGNAEKLNAMATLEFEFCPKCGNKLGGAE